MNAHQTAHQLTLKMRGLTYLFPKFFGFLFFAMGVTLFFGLTPDENMPLTVGMKAGLFAGGMCLAALGFVMMAGHSEIVIDKTQNQMTRQYVCGLAFRKKTTSIAGCNTVYVTRENRATQNGGSVRVYVVSLLKDGETVDVDFGGQPKIIRDHAQKIADFLNWELQDTGG